MVIFDTSFLACLKIFTNIFFHFPFSAFLKKFSFTGSSFVNLSKNVCQIFSFSCTYLFSAFSKSLSFIGSSYVNSYKIYFQIFPIWCLLLSKVVIFSVLSKFQPIELLYPQSFWFCSYLQLHLNIYSEFFKNLVSFPVLCQTLPLVFSNLCIYPEF